MIPRGALAARDGRIVWIGDGGRHRRPPGRRRRRRWSSTSRARAVVPGFVDAHTHLILAGERAGEYGRRLGGASYLEIQEAGGGIISTVRATRAATEEQLAALTRARLDSFLRHGTTTLEVKSGYGLTLEDERKQLAAAKVAASGAPRAHRARRAPHARGVRRPRRRVHRPGVRRDAAGARRRGRVRRRVLRRGRLHRGAVAPRAREGARARLPAEDPRGGAGAHRRRGAGR